MAGIVELATGLITGNVLAATGVAIAVVVAGLSSAKGLEISGSTAAAVTGEKEENFSNALVLEALPQTQCVYGFIVGVLITLGIMSGNMTLEKGLIGLAAGITVGITGISAISQGKVASAAIGATTKNPKISGKVLIFIVMPEIAALFGFVTAVLLLVSGKVF
ncbi:MAG: V-type ATP synthase subunit K [Candidatus Altiarchaeota archaeon]